MKFLGVVVNDVVVAAVNCNGNGLTTTTDRLLSQPFRFWGLSIMNVVSQYRVFEHILYFLKMIEMKFFD